jgi:hypothetical protein
MDIGLKERLKKFEQEHEIYVDAQDLLNYWTITARIPKKGDGVHSTHYMRQFITARHETGVVIVIPDPEVYMTYLVEDWGRLESIDDFVDKALPRILADKEESDAGTQESCGQSCG